MKEITIQSFAKINLSIDVGQVMESGMHPVDMIMQQLSFHDDVKISFEEDRGRPFGDVEIQVKTNRYYIPCDERNLAYKAAALMIEEYGGKVCGGKLSIDIFKRIPVAAGLAGGSGNGAAVLHGLNVLWDLRLNLDELCKLGERLGSDVPFCVMGQACSNFCLPKNIRKDEKAVSCARAQGTGTTLKPLKGIRKPVVIAKPPIGVSTKDVYTGIDHCEINVRPNNDELAKGVMLKDFEKIYANCINVLECYTLSVYPEVEKLKKEIQAMPEAKNASLVLMSGSGPTIFSVYETITDAKNVCSKLRENGYEAYWTKTTK